MLFQKPQFKMRSSVVARSKYGDNSVIDLVLVVQHDHVGNPTNIADFLFAKLDPGIKDSEMELLFERHLILEGIVLIYQVFYGLPLKPRIGLTALLLFVELLHLIEKLLVFWKRLQSGHCGGLIPSISKLFITIGVQVTESREQRISFLAQSIASQISVQRIESHQENTEICL